MNTIAFSHPRYTGSDKLKANTAICFVKMGDAPQGNNYKWCWFLSRFALLTHKLLSFLRQLGLLRLPCEAGHQRTLKFFKSAFGPHQVRVCVTINTHFLSSSVSGTGGLLVFMKAKELCDCTQMNDHSKTHSKNGNALYFL